ncbi:MAG: uncharacterized protein QOD25_2233 [Alphaproteobacteria bacterium]|jgi:hypothetical protein|nr:uncharacterized protein [Alphaproteobacteria bacterium]
MVLEFVYETRTESIPERTDSPTHLWPDRPADLDPLHLAAAAAALDQGRDQPSDARHAAKLGVAVQVSGHTHGGLILGVDRLAARANAGFVSGRYDVEG